MRQVVQFEKKLNLKFPNKKIQYYHLHQLHQLHQRHQLHQLHQLYQLHQLFHKLQLLIPIVLLLLMFPFLLTFQSLFLIIFIKKMPTAKITNHNIKEIIINLNRLTIISIKIMENTFKIIMPIINMDNS
jgi:hypothetical protein